MSARGGFRILRSAGLLLLVRRSLRQHALSTCITALSVALASGLVMAVFSVKQQTHEAFTGSSVGFDAVLGARGSQLQLVLNTVFHLETSPGNIPWAMYQEIRKDPAVQLAIPYVVGDNYRGFRIVGTTEELFTEFEYQEGRKFTLQPGGRLFDPTLQEAVIGSFVAQRTRLRVGSVFNPYHGITSDEGQRHAVNYVVVGVLEPTNSPSDRVLWIPLEGVFRMPGHWLRGSGKDFEAKGGEEIPDSEKEVSAVMLKFRSPQAGFQLEQKFNRQGNKATLAWPIERSMLDLFDKIGWVDKVLTLVAYLVVAVSAGSILASIYNTMNERRREFAILRALGARRRTVFSAIVLESGTIAAMGSIIGFIAYGVILGIASAIVRAQTGVVLDLWKAASVQVTDTFSVSILVAAPLCMIAIGAAAGIVPALKAYQTDVASNLAPAS
ncbi:MAG: ABC transporter permease [Planctomycetota bacterium]|nr:ABC transporter permease [Planctomycetota bacterium]